MRKCIGLATLLSILCIIAPLFTAASDCDSSTIVQGCMLPGVGSFDCSHETMQDEELCTSSECQLVDATEAIFGAFRVIITDQFGNPVLDANGQPTYEIKRDQNGNPILENGQVIYIWKVWDCTAVRTTVDDPNFQRCQPRQPQQAWTNSLCVTVVVGGKFVYARCRAQFSCSWDPLLEKCTKGAECGAGEGAPTVENDINCTPPTMA